jgi:hypothetical protein
MADGKSYTKYQVYFFLYLAVICELLIIIVERDEAEASFLSEREKLLRTIERIVQEMTQITPVAITRGTNQMKVGETRQFDFVIQGVGDNDDITQPPRMRVLRNGAEIGELRYGNHIVEADNVEEAALVKGQRRYVFSWTAPATGRYEFLGSAGTGRMMRMGDSVKMGNLMFDYDEIRKVYPQIDDLLRDGVINSSITVDVISPPSQLSIFTPREVITAVGFPITAPIEVQGMTGRDVRVGTLTGSVTRNGDQVVWSGTGTEPGSKTVDVVASGNRGEGARDQARGSFTLTAVAPVPKQKLPEKAFVKETFKMNVQVAGLEDASRYAWTITEDGVKTAAGTGVHVAHMPKGAGRMVITATYMGREYPVEGHGTSTFAYNVQPLQLRALGGTFTKGGTYAINHRFTFRMAYRGRYAAESSEPVPANAISIEVLDERGNDLLDEGSIDITPVTQHTDVSFRLRGKVARDGVDATIRISVRGESTTEVPVVITPD